jgi:hypothetical protein
MALSRCPSLRISANSEAVKLSSGLFAAFSKTLRSVSVMGGIFYLPGRMSYKPATKHKIVSPRLKIVAELPITLHSLFFQKEADEIRNITVVRQNRSCVVTSSSTKAWVLNLVRREWLVTQVNEHGIRHSGFVTANVDTTLRPSVGRGVG